MAKQNVKQSAPAEETLNIQESFFLKNRKAIIGCVVAVVLIIAGVIVYKNYVSDPRENKASTILAKGQEYFANGDYEKALKGDKKDFPGFEAVASEYGSTDAGNLANLYAGLCYVETEKWQEAVNSLEKFSKQGDQMISPAAEAALGNAYAHLKQLDKAVSCLKSAAAKADNNSLSPTFLIQAGEILESQGKADEALKCYKEVKEKYFNSMAYQTIDKYIERVTK